MNLATPQSVRKLQRALYAKAKANSAYRFYTLYDKIYRKDVLKEAWSRCRANDGSSGVDGQSFVGIESKGVEAWLEQLAQELRTKTYRPQAVRRVNIPKADGKTRPLGIPTIKDRVAQMAAVIVLEAIFEADLTDEQYAYRPKRSAHDAIRKVHQLFDCKFFGSLQYRGWNLVAVTNPIVWHATLFRGSGVKVFRRKRGIWSRCFVGCGQISAEVKHISNQEVEPLRQ